MSRGCLAVGGVGPYARGGRIRTKTRWIALAEMRWLYPRFRGCDRTQRPPRRRVRSIRAAGGSSSSSTECGCRGRAKNDVKVYDYIVCDNSAIAIRGGARLKDHRVLIGREFLHKWTSGRDEVDAKAGRADRQGVNEIGRGRVRDRRCGHTLGRPFERHRLKEPLCACR